MKTERYPEADPAAERNPHEQLDDAGLHVPHL